MAFSETITGIGATQGFIFDCDGCLLDSMGIWGAVERETIEMAGAELTPGQLMELRAANFHDAIRGLVALGGNASAEAIEEQAENRLMTFYRHQATAKPGALAFVKTLHEQGIRTAVVSASALRYLEAGLRRTGLWDYFDMVVSMDELHATKADPEVFLDVCRQLGTRPGATWGADDSLVVVRTMHAAGMHAVGTYDDDASGTFAQLEAEADIAVRSFAELDAYDFAR